MDKIFREYDIRGVYGTDLTDDIAFGLGRAFGTLLRRRKFARTAVARDGRSSSPALFESLVRGINSSGVGVLDIGICPTPLLYFSLFQFPVDGGVMITASHNPGEYNGFKLCLGRDTLHGEQIQDLKRMIQSRDFDEGKAPPNETREVIPAYLDYIKEQFRGLEGGSLKVVVDSGNGMGGLVGPEALRLLGCEVVELYSEVDSRFPNHHPDPTVEKNLEDLIRTVKKEKADLGVAFDGDADRIGAVDEKGGIIWGDQLMVIFSREILKKRPGATIISEVKASQTLYDDIRKKGGREIMWKAGHSLIKSKMKETRAALAGEMSGHIFFADRYFGYDDAVYSACRLVEILLHRPRPLSSLLNDLPGMVSTPEIRVDCPDDVKFEVVKKMIDRFEVLKAEKPRKNLKIRDLITIDGIRIVFETGWALVRASNTGPLLVLRFESESGEGLDLIRKFVEKELSAVMPGPGQ